MTLKELKAEGRKRGFTVAKEDGEYRICEKGRGEDFANYTTDIDDAFGTMKAMEYEAAHQGGVN